MGAVFSSLDWVSEVEFSRLEVAECGVQADVVVLIDELLHFALGGEVVVAVLVRALSSHGADSWRGTFATILTTRWPAVLPILLT
jgi:hypothetical protein